MFIIIVEALGRRIKEWRNAGKIYGIALSNAPIINIHSHFMDDTVIIGKTSMVEERDYLNILKLYEGES